MKRKRNEAETGDNNERHVEKVWRSLNPRERELDDISEQAIRDADASFAELRDVFRERIKVGS